MSEDGATLFRKIPRSLPVDRPAIRRFHKLLQHEVAEGLTFDCLLTNDVALQALNLEFLQKDYPTDVLSFPTEGIGGTIGDLAVSVERAAAQSADFGHSLTEELQILMLHGTLHLMGLDHETDKGKMRKLETSWRKHFNLPTGLLERNRR